MKVRKGFVSNSSSSSFLVYGSTIGDGALEKYIETHNIACEYTDNESMLDVILEHIEKDTGMKLDIEYIYTQDYSEPIVGKSWGSVGDNETGGEFKKKIEESVKTLFGNSSSCSTCEDAWRDG